MYRIPTVSYISVWYGNTCQYGGLLPLDSFDDELHLSITEGFESVTRIAVLDTHPQEFVDASGKVDIMKLKQLDKIIKYILDNKWYYGQIITFTAWYQWREG